MEEKTEKVALQIVVDKNRLIGEMERVLTECSNAVFIGLAAIDKLDESPEFLSGENSFMIHRPFLQQMNLEQSKSYFKTWVIKKGFEDLIKGVTLMLIDVCKVIRKRNKLTEKNPDTFEQLKEILGDAEHSVSQEHFPKLIDMIKPYLTSDLTYLNEVNSINRVRRCLVHRDGIVTPIDFQNGEDKLRLNWVCMEPIYEEDGKQSYLAPMMQISGKGKLIIKEQKREKRFNETDHIEIDYELFNELIWTAFRFGADLINKFTFSLPEIDNNKKNSN